MLFDMKDKTFTEMMDRRQSTLHNRVSTLSSKYYPQLLEKIIAINAPSWMTWVLSFFKSILPEKTTSKIELCESPEALWNSDYGRRTFNLDYVPELLGGRYPDSKIRESLTGSLIEYKKNEWT